MNIAADLDRVAGARPDHPALVVDGEEVWSYRELDLRASRIATGLEQAGVVPGARVAIFMQNWPEHVAAWYGIAKSGGVPVDVNVLLGDEEWTFILGNCRPTAVICGVELATRLAKIVASLEHSCPVFTARGTSRDEGSPLDALGAGTSARRAVERGDDDLAVIAYTSGTTGVPKGVMHNHGILRLHLELMREMLGYTSDDLVANLLPLFALHAFLCQAAIAVHLGATFLLVGKFDPAVLARVSRRQSITSATFVPAIVNALLQMPESARPVFAEGRAFNVGGAPLHPEVRDRFEDAFGVTLLQGFGSTEVMGAVAMERADRRAPWGSCGEAWPGLRFRVVDPFGDDVPDGETGEFAVHRDRATVGYWDDPTQTAAVFLDAEWYLMGDLGRVDADGFIYVLDRKKDMIIRGGFNIYSAEIERVLNERPEVLEATVLGVPHDRLGEVPVALVVATPGTDADALLGEELRDYTAERLGRLKAPEEVRFVALETLPRNAMGKVLKRELRRLAALP